MTTTIYVVRHGHAVMNAPSDPERPLSEIGEQEAVKAAQHLKAINPDVVLVSPYLRAQQTAEIICKEAGISIDITTEPGITPDDNPSQVANRLAEFEGKTIVMVSHNPLVSALISWFMEGHYHGPYAMGTASVACLEFDQIGTGLGQLKWLKHVN